MIFVNTIFMIFLLYTSSLFAIQRPVNYSRIIDKITNEFAKSVQNSDDLILIGSGGAFKGDIKEISLTFSINRSLNIETGRRLMVEKAEILLQMINDNNDVRPFLHNFPFTTKNLNLVISGVKDTCVLHGASLVTILAGKIYYDDTSYKTIYVESYEDALQIVKGGVQRDYKQSPKPTPLSLPLSKKND